MMKYRMALLSAFLNLLGSFLVFLSFQAASTNLLLVTEKGTKNVAFCIGDRAVFGLTKDGRGTAMGYGCPQGVDAKPAAVVNTDSPGLAKFGWILIGFGFFLQMFSIEKPQAVTVPHISYGPRQRSPKK
jgi:hypothetical protein